MPWTDEMVESLKKMWEEGLSTGEIGRRLGVSKNSIVGKVHRLQLVARPSPIKKKDDNSSPSAKKDKTTAKTQTKEPVKQIKESTSKQSAKPTEKIQPEVKPAKTQPQPKSAPKIETATKVAKDVESDTFINVSIPVVHNPKKPGDKITVTDLDNHTCRWPIGDPKDENFHFCGAPVKIGQTYCEEHAAIAYVKNIKK